MRGAGVVLGASFKPPKNDDAVVDVTPLVVGLTPKNGLIRGALETPPMVLG